MNNMIIRSSNSVAIAQDKEDQETGAKKLLTHAKELVNNSKINKVRIKITNGYILTSHPEDWENVKG